MPADFRAKQLEFTRHIRDPDCHPMPADVKPERMAMYRELVYNNIEDFLAKNFPVIRKILADENWHELVQDFIVTHHSYTPYFAEIAEEFLDYLENERPVSDRGSEDFPFLLELAHYEWVELALSIAKEEVSTNQLIQGALGGKGLCLSPLAWPLLYQYPVQAISPEFLPDIAPDLPTCLVAYRDTADQVRFLAINLLTYRMLAIIQEQPGIALAACLQQLAEECPEQNPEALFRGGTQTAQDFAGKGIILAV